MPTFKNTVLTKKNIQSAKDSRDSKSYCVSVILEERRLEGEEITAASAGISGESVTHTRRTPKDRNRVRIKVKERGVQGGKLKQLNSLIPQSTIGGVGESQTPDHV